MAKQVKRASLLSEADKQKLLKKAGNKKPLAKAQAATTAPSAPVSDRMVSAQPALQKQKSGSIGIGIKLWSVVAALLLIAFILVPKPKLLEYESAGLTTQSIYMPGWFGAQGTILDTNQRALLAEDEEILYLCFAGQSNEQCTKYQIRQQQSFIAAAQYWLSTQP